MRVYLKKIIYLLNKTEKKKIFILFFLLTGSGVLEALTIGSIPLIISTIFYSEKLGELSFLNFKIDQFINLSSFSNYDLIFYALTFLLIIFFIKNFFLVFVNYYELNFCKNFSVRLSNALMEKYINRSLISSVNTNTSSLIRNLSTEIKSFVNIVRFLVQILKESIIFLFVFVLLIFFDFKSTLIIFLFFLILSFFYIRFVQNKINFLGKKILELKVVTIKKISEIFQGFLLTKAYNLESIYKNQFNLIIEKKERYFLFKGIIEFLPKPLLEIFAILFILILIFINYETSLDINRVLPIIIVFILGISRIIPIFFSVNRAAISIIHNKPVVSLIYSEFKKKTYSLNSYKKVIKKNSLKIKFKKIYFNNVEFYYDKKNYLKINNLTIKKGDKVGIVGESGSGKSTFIYMLFGFIKPQKGIIKVDNTPITNVLNNWKNLIGFVPQDTYISDDDIIHNIALGEKNINIIDKERVRNILKSLNLDHLFNNESSTKLGEFGRKLSGGERQRIGIARALYRKCEILILDEVTSSLDRKNEKHIVDLVKKIPKNITIFMVSHKYTSLKNCDYLLKIKNKKVFKEI